MFQNNERPINVYFKKTHPDAVLPIQTSLNASGFDISTPYDFTIRKNEIVIVDTGLQLAYITPGFEIQIRSRSGLAAKNGIVVLNSPGTIDNDYRGVIKIILYNYKEDFSFKKHQRIAQMIFAPVMKADIAFSDVDFLKTDRNPEGLGSSGI